MATENGTAKTIIFDMHEERISRLEEARVSNATEMAQQTAALEDIKEKLLEVKDAIRESSNTMVSVVEKLESQISSNAERINKLEDSKDIKVKKMEFNQKLIYALWVGIGSAAAMIIERLLTH